jgi:hypothetical protein
MVLLTVGIRCSRAPAGQNLMKWWKHSLAVSCSASAAAWAADRQAASNPALERFEVESAGLTSRQ